jgi:hypothetical protein
MYGNFSTTSKVRITRGTSLQAACFQIPQGLQITGWMIKLFNFWYVRASLHYHVQTSYSANSTSYLTGNKTLFLEVKWPEHEATYSTEIMEALYPYPLYIFMARCLNKGITVPVITCTTWFTKYPCSWKHLTNYMMYSWEANRPSSGKDMLHLYGPEGSLPHSQQPITATIIQCTPLHLYFNIISHLCLYPRRHLAFNFAY